MPTRGFTIVELLIVIVVIAILASISIVAYNGVQGRAQDSRRLSDMAKIKQGIELYRIQNGVFPPVMSANTDSTGWEVSYGGSFIPPLVSSSIMSTVPFDPLNTSSNYYRYFRYAAGTQFCDAAKGDFYVLQVRKAQNTVKIDDGGPGFQCGSGANSRNWWSEGVWTTGGFMNG